MTDGTRAPSAPNETQDWPDLLCLPEVRLRLSNTVETGEALLHLVSSWSQTTRDLLGDFNLAEELAETSNRFAVVTDGN